MTAPDLRPIVEAKRDARTLAPEEVETFVSAFSRGEVSSELAAAFLMAAYIRGLSGVETLALARAMVASGRTLPLAGVSRPKLDKHSTGGVADGVTLVLAPLVASVGLGMAKLSGRGLGHTGGTIDKLESIPGLRTDFTAEELERQVEEVGCAVAGQSPDLVPADGGLYALRDATATVPSAPLIAASVMAKKLAVGSDLILLDVKAGSGAFMKDEASARELAEACIEIARASERRAVAAVTDMSQPLGCAIGNALDVAEAIEVLSGGESPAPHLRDLAISFAVRALVELSGEEPDRAERRARDALASGAALSSFARMVEAQGGDPRVAEQPAQVLPVAPVQLPVTAMSDGYLQTVDAAALGRASMVLGAGRARKGGGIDAAVGIVFTPKVGDRIEAGQEVAMVHARDADAASEASRRVLEAMTLSDSPQNPTPLIHGWVE